MSLKFSGGYLLPATMCESVKLSASLLGSLQDFYFSYSLPGEVTWVSAPWAAWPHPTAWSQMEEHVPVWPLSSFSSWFICEPDGIFTNWTVVVSLESAICLALVADFRASAQAFQLSLQIHNPTKHKLLSDSAPGFICCLLVHSFKLQVWSYLHLTSLITPFKALQWVRLDFLTHSEFLKLLNSFKVNKTTQASSWKNEKYRF